MLHETKIHAARISNSCSVNYFFLLQEFLNVVCAIKIDILSL